MANWQFLVLCLVGIGICKLLQALGDRVAEVEKRVIELRHKQRMREIKQEAEEAAARRNGPLLDRKVT